MNRIWQNLPSMTFKTGLYDGITTIREARSRGDFGVGQFSALDGELIVADARVAGALTAKLLTRAGFRVLVLEAGPATAESFDGYANHLQTFYAAGSKGPESAWPPADGAPQPGTGRSAIQQGLFRSAGSYPTLTLAALTMSTTFDR